MARLRNNILANYAGQAWVALMGVAFVPLYLRLLGPERFGMIAFMLSLQAISLILDFGVSVFLSRELAQRAHDPKRRETIRQLVRSFEWLVWPMAVFIAATVFANSGLIADHWLEPEELDYAATVSAIKVIAVIVALLWPTSFYGASLSGLERQPLMNALTAGFATLRFVGVVPILYYADEPLRGFLWWHAAVATAQTGCSAFLVWRLLPDATAPPRFSAREIIGARGFALGVFVVSALGLTLGQLDRLAVSALRPLGEFGYYAVALTLSAGLGRLVQPMFVAVYPRFSRLIAHGDRDQLSDLYHLASQILAVIVAATAGVICANAEFVLLLWTGNPELSARVALPLALLFAGSAINGLMNLPYALQLAHGWTRLAALSNLVAVVVALPLYVMAIERFGITGAAAVWLGVNLANLIFVLPLMHKRLLPGELWDWYLRDVVPPLIAATAISVLLRWVTPQDSSALLRLAWLCTVSVLTLCSAAVAARGTRQILLHVGSRQWLDELCGLWRKQ